MPGIVAEFGELTGEEAGDLDRTPFAVGAERVLEKAFAAAVAVGIGHADPLRSEIEAAVRRKGIAGEDRPGVAPSGVFAEAPWPRFSYPDLCADLSRFFQDP